MDKWFTGPILGDRHFGPWGLPNDESPEGLWTGLDVKADPNFAAVLDARRQQHDRFEAFIETLDVEALPATVTVLENGEVPSLVCFHVVLEEEFEHLRYMTRDLTRLGVSLDE
jgi:hypothetical protein